MFLRSFIIPFISCTVLLLMKLYQHFSFNEILSTLFLTLYLKIAICEVIVLIFRDRFERICKREIEVPGMTIMRDVAIAKSEFTPGQKAITKIQDFQNDEVLFSYCALPEVIQILYSTPYTALLSKSI